MSEIKEFEKLYEIDGGADISGSLINAFSTGIKTVMNVGRSLGTAIRRIISGSLCEV